MSNRTQWVIFGLIVAGGAFAADLINLRFGVDGPYYGVGRASRTVGVSLLGATVGLLLFALASRVYRLFKGTSMSGGPLAVVLVASLLLGQGAVLGVLISDRSESVEAEPMPRFSASAPPEQPPLRSVRRRITLTARTRARLTFEQIDLSPDCGGSILDDVALKDADGKRVFSDRFDGEAIGLGQTALRHWTVTGNVDVIGEGSQHDLYPGNGKYLDLDGTTGCVSSVIRSRPIQLSDGSYELFFELGSNPHGGGLDNSIRVQLGHLYEQTFSSN